MKPLDPLRVANQGRLPAPPQQSTIQREWVVVGVLTALYLALPTRNSTLDAWYYAACVRHGHELLLPHHLLYNAAGWLWLRLLHGAGLHPAPLAALKLLNALAAGGCLVVLRALLRRVGPPTTPVASWLLVAGASFGFMRFATENEAYVLPLLFSLLGSLQWARYQLAEKQRQAYLWLAGFWAALACLFHQIHVFWWVGLLAGTGWLSWRPVRALLLYASGALLVPAAYVGALYYWQLPRTAAALWHFVLHDYYAGTATNSLSGKGLLLTVVNLVRTFGQVHGSTLALLGRVPLLAVVPLVAGVLVVDAGRRWQRQKTDGKPAATNRQRTVGWVHGAIFALQLLFAALSAGNAEFMVMLPLLLPVVVVPLWTLPGRSVAAGGAVLLLWNLTFGLLPAHLLTLGAAPTQWLGRVQQQPTALFLLDNPNLTRNQLHYYSGQATAPPNVLAAPAQLLQARRQSPAALRAWLRQQQQRGHRLFTDALGGPQLLDRAHLVFSTQNEAVLRGFRRTRVDSCQTFLGTYYLTELR